MKIALIIAKKELLEIFRDKSTLVFLLLPLLIFPIFNLGMDFISKEGQTEITVCIECDNNEMEQFINAFVQGENGFTLRQIPSNYPIKLLKTGEIDCIIKITDSDFDFIYNSSSYNSLSTATKLGEAIQKNYYSYLGKTTCALYQFNLKDENNKTSDISNSISNIFIPTILVLFIFQGVTNFSNDLFAGEKERKTFELLLLSTDNRKSIYLGKTLALLLISFINVMVSLFGFIFSNVILENNINQFRFMQTESPLIHIALIVIALILLSAVAVFITSSISLISKNFKMSQLLNELALFVPVGMTVMLCLGFFNPNNKIIKYIPVLNIVNIFNDAFTGQSSLSDVIPVILSTCALLFIMTFLCSIYIRSEKCIQ